MKQYNSFHYDLLSKKKKENNFFYKPLSSFLAFITLILTWQSVASIFLPGSKFFPSPIDVINAFIKEISLSSLFMDCVASLSRVAVGLMAAMIFGIGIGMILGTMKRIGAFLENIIEFIRPIPPIAWIPLSILWFGIGEASAYFIIFLAAFFPIFVNSYSAANSINTIHINVARSLKVKWPLFIKHILWPSALPQVITGVRVGLGFAWMAVIASEMVAAQSGLGYMIQVNRLLLESDRVVAGMVVIGLIGYFMNQIALKIGKTLTPWKQKSA
jgi:NitT/TauT family transport system permease protein/sulfonate transport system permease protein